MFIYDNRFGQSASLGLTDDATAAELVTSAGQGHSLVTITLAMTAADLRGLATEAEAMADEIDTATIAAEVQAAAADIDGPGADWPGRRVACTEGSSHWHAARDGADRTLCNLFLITSALGESSVTSSQKMCPTCEAAVTAALIATGQIEPPAPEDAPEPAPAAEVMPAGNWTVAEWMASSTVADVMMGDLDTRSYHRRLTGKFSQGPAFGWVNYMELADLRARTAGELPAGPIPHTEPSGMTAAVSAHVAEHVTRFRRQCGAAPTAALAVGFTRQQQAAPAAAPAADQLFAYHAMALLRTVGRQS
jgi:hypothetical protein